MVESSDIRVHTHAVTDDDITTSIRISHTYGISVGDNIWVVIVRPTKRFNLSPNSFCRGLSYRKRVGRKRDHYVTGTHLVWWNPEWWCLRCSWPSWIRSVVPFWWAPAATRAPWATSLWSPYPRLSGRPTAFFPIAPCAASSCFGPSIWCSWVQASSLRVGRQTRRDSPKTQCPVARFVFKH